MNRPTRSRGVAWRLERSRMRSIPMLAAIALAVAPAGCGLPGSAARPVRTSRTARWEHEAALEGDVETFGAEGNPTGNPIGGGEGYSDIVTRGHYTARTLDELRDALKQATAGQVVFLPGDVELDLGGQRALTVPAGVTVASTRGWRGSKGALLFSDKLATPGFFATGGDCVRITGLRLRGPYPHREPVAFHSRCLRTSHFGLEVDNCELSGFGICAVGVGTGASRAYVHHNSIHHNQRSGYGYGVCIGGGDCLVEANLFDWCRHHIASSGTPGSSYEARYNLCLEHANGHLFDMHGGRDRGDGTDIAGDWMNIHHNTFRSTVRSIVIRGVPSQGARVHHNWFLHPDPANAVRTSGNTQVTRNVFGGERKRIEK